MQFLFAISSVKCLVPNILIIFSMTQLITPYSSMFLSGDSNATLHKCHISEAYGESVS